LTEYAKAGVVHVNDSSWCIGAKGHEVSFWYFRKVGPLPKEYTMSPAEWDGAKVVFKGAGSAPEIYNLDDNEIEISEILKWIKAHA
jgi:hypothetical protein